MKSFRIWVSFIAVLTFVILAGCGGGSSDGVGVSTNNQFNISTVKEMSETGISGSEEHIARSSSAEITIPANSISGNYDLSISKINTANLDSTTLSYLKSQFGFDEKVQFFSPIINCDISLNNDLPNVFRASLNVNSDGFLLKNVGNILLRNDKSITDWVNKHYYLAFSNEKKAKWFYTPLNKEHFNNNFNQLSFNINKIAKYYVIVAIVTEINTGLIPELPDFTNTETNTSTNTNTSTSTNTNTQTQTQTNTNTNTNTNTDTNTDFVTYLNINANPDILIASDSGKFIEDMKLYVSLEYSGSNPFAYTTPTIEFLSFTPFDLGNSVKSNYHNDYYVYNYKSFISPQSEINGIATFVLTLPTKNVKYDSNKHPANLFATAKFKSKSNRDYESEPTKISFVHNPPAPVIATPTIITSFNIALNETQFLIATDSNIFNNDLIIDGNIYYEGSKPSYGVAPISIDFISANSFDFGNDDWETRILGYFDGNLYSCSYEVPSYTVVIYEETKSASFSVIIPLKNTIYDIEKHPENIFIKAKIDNKESNQVALKINKLQKTIGENPPSNLIVNTVFPNNSNYLNGIGSVALSLTWSGDDMPFTANFKYNNNLIYSVASITENRIDVNIPTYLVLDFDDKKYIEIEIIDSSNRSTSALSKSFVVDIEPPELIASTTNGSIFSVKGNVQILISSNKPITNPDVSCEGINAVLAETLASNTKFIYNLQLNTDFANGNHLVSIVASDTTEPTESANSSSAIATFTVDTSIQFPFANGSGTASDPFLIATAEDLNNVRYYPDYYYKQVADIDLNEFISSRTDTRLYPSDSDTNSTAGWLPIDGFSKVYDGDNHKINNLVIDRLARDNVGLFGLLGDNAIIKNISMNNYESYSGPILYGRNNVGLIVGSAIKNNIIENCHVSGSASGTECVGGIAGAAYKIINCSVEGWIEGKSKVGGIVGQGNVINNCQNNSCDLISKYQSVISESFGGIVGVCNDGEIYNCISSNFYFGSWESSINSFGGIVGDLINSEIINCNSNSNFGFEYGNPSLIYNFGGIVGQIKGNNNKIYNCHYEGEISFSGNTIKNISGILGYNNSDDLVIENCYSISNNNIIINSNSYETVLIFGGIVGNSDGLNMKIDRCFTKVNFNIDQNNYYATGICGNFNDGTISNCIAFTDSKSFGIAGLDYYYYDHFYSTDNHNNINHNIENCLAISNNAIYAGIFRNSFNDKTSVSNCFVANDSSSANSSNYKRIIYGSYINSEDSLLNNNYGWNTENVTGERLANNENGADATKSEFWGASTQQSFWVNKLGWDFDNIWEFRAGYNLPQLKGLPSVPDPDYLVNAD